MHGSSLSFFSVPGVHLLFFVDMILVKIKIQKVVIDLGFFKSQNLCRTNRYVFCMWKIKVIGSMLV